MAYGAIDERTQPMFGRDCELGDWVADTLGLRRRGRGPVRDQLLRPPPPRLGRPATDRRLRRHCPAQCRRGRSNAGFARNPEIVYAKVGVERDRARQALAFAPSLASAASLTRSTSSTAYACSPAKPQPRHFPLPVLLRQLHLHVCLVVVVEPVADQVRAVGAWPCLTPAPFPSSTPP